MKKKNFTMILNHFERMHLTRDTFLVPYYIGLECDFDVTIVYPRTENNTDLPDVYRGVKLHPISHGVNKSSHSFFFKVVLYLIKNARRIDILMTLFILMGSGRISLLYKLLNPKGISYVKLDIPTYMVGRVSSLFKDQRLKEKLKKQFYIAYFKRVNLFSCETSDAYDLLVNDEQLAPYFKDKTMLLENACDDILVNEIAVKPKSFEEKENIFITVGRLGTKEKRTEFLLEGLKHTEFKDWKAYLIGPINNEFTEYKDNFFKENPHLIDKIIFTGAIYDEKILWEYYSRAKVFILTSSTESSGLVFYEAKIFHDYIVTTHVGAARDVIIDGCGKITDMHDPKILGEILSDITSGKINIDTYQNIDTSGLFWSNRIKLLKARLNNLQNIK
ncbi:glycosyltransferase [Dysgonomonas sp. Marseille-P4361]|uniref:glycosyltransferase n=1 Tax=Dysgonomonas sp. Marseille-P4361 TaxID=2161820 RepID=UPI000D5513AF|nr:glycosyltransferase [Dysgonomonas sp. Marseille-P4361]